MIDERTGYVEGRAYELAVEEAEPRRCGALTTKGAQCRFSALPDSSYCESHQGWPEPGTALPVLRSAAANGAGPSTAAVAPDARIVWINPNVRKHLPIFLLCVAILIVGVVVTGRDRSTPAELDPISNDSVAFWSVLDPSRVFVDAIQGPDGERALHVEVRPRRSYFTILSHDFKQPVDLSARPYLFLNFNGKGTDHVYQFLVNFTANSSAFALYEIRDYKRGWRQVSLDARSPKGAKGKPDWKHVTGFRLAAADKKAGDFALGSIGAATRADVRR